MANYGAKYGNVKSVYKNIKMDSQAERRRYIELELLQKAGKIKDLETQVKFILFPKYKDKAGKVRLAITYRADSKYYEIDTGITIVEDVKSVATAKDKVYCMKKKMVIKLLMEMELEDGKVYEFREEIR